jgi:hypothetical protein
MQAGGDDYLMKTDSLDRILERIRYWAGSEGRQNMKERRLAAQKVVEVATVFR